MDIYSKRGRIELDQFSIYFRMRIRRSTMSIADSSDDERYAYYASQINESFETVKRCATIEGEEPTQRIIDRLGLKVGKPHYVRRDYEE